MSYDAKRQIALVEVNDRTHHVYREIEFAVPAFTVAGAKVLSRKWQEDGEPAKEPAAVAGAPPLPGMLTSGSQAGWLALGMYHPSEDLTACTAYGQGKVLISTPVANAGDRILLSLTCAGGPHLVVVSKTTRRIAPVALPPEALLGEFHLTSDSRYVLAQGPGQERYTKSDTVWLADLQNGKVLGHWQNSRLTTSAFLGFAPGGKLLFQSKEDGLVEATGVSFVPTPGPDSFFADR